MGRDSDEPVVTELDELRARLAEAEETLKAIRQGRIDAIVVDSPEGARIFTVAGAERPYRVFIEQMGEGAASLSAIGEILYCNRQFADMLRVSETAITGSSIWDFLSPEDKVSLRDWIAFAKTESRRQEVTLIRQDGSTLPIYLSATLFNDNSVRSLCLVATDLSERKRAEEALHQAQKMDAIGQLTAGIAHDFNNLLMAVVGSIDLALQRTADSKLRELLERAVRASERGTRLVQHLLAFSRKQPMQAVPVDLGQIADRAREMFGGWIGPEISITRQDGGDLWAAMADPTQIELALLNLALNARDAMPRGGGLMLGTRNVPAGDPSLPEKIPGGDFVALSVQDSGSGIPRDMLSRVFEPFFTTKEFGRGSGLGLSMVYGVVTQLGGAVHLASELNRGTVVTLFLPRARVLGESAAPVAEAGQEFSGLRVLLVEDDREVREVTAEILRHLGYKVDEAESGPAALALLDKGAIPDVLVTDFAMPVMRGSQVAREVQRRLPQLPVLVVTGYNEFSRLDEKLPYAVLRKPFKPHDLAAALAACLQQESRRQGQA